MINGILIIADFLEFRIIRNLRGFLSCFSRPVHLAWDYGIAIVMERAKSNGYSRRWMCRFYVFSS